MLHMKIRKGESIEVGGKEIILLKSGKKSATLGFVGEEEVPIKRVLKQKK